MTVELPKDAEGREIPLDTNVLYDSDGIEFFTDKSMYMRLTDEWWFFGHFGSSISTHRVAATRLHLTPPDSWEKLLDDLDKAASKMYCGTCTYLGKNHTNCDTCAIGDISACDSAAMRDIASRIRKLRGEDDD